MYHEGSLCPCCRAKPLDKYGDHSLHCAADVGVKHRHNGVRNTLADVFTKAGVSVQVEAKLGMVAGDDTELRPADILIFGWDQGKDSCIDITGISPFAGGSSEHSVAAAARRKKQKYSKKCEDEGYSFHPFSFSTLGQLDSEASELVHRVQQIMRAHAMGSKDAAYIFPRIGYAIQRGVGAQLLARLPTNYG
ncbi:hypothetical protein ACHQM5_016576 [Ranunculus cassubicifolius]